MARAPYLLALSLLSCAGPRLVHDDVAGCYAVQWRSDDDTAYLTLNPDSILLSSERYLLPVEVAGQIEVADYRKARLVRRPRESGDTGYGEVLWEDHDTWWWWRLQNDSVVFATGHDAADLMGFRAAVRSDRLSGEGVWHNDYGPGAAFSVTGRRIPCPERIETL